MRKLLDDYEYNQMLHKYKDPKFLKASKLRQQFFKKWILNKHTNFYKT